jgi:hypothetical protein
MRSPRSLLFRLTGLLTSFILQGGVALAADKFVGKWELVQAPGASDELQTMEFLPGGKLRYVFETRSKKEIVNLVYFIENDTIVTDQPSHPQTERTRFRFEDDNTLVLEHDGILQRFKREKIR